MEDYLKAVYVLQMETAPPVATSDIAGYLDVTAPTVSSMVGDLEERGLVTREKYEGVELTPEGETVALEVLRHHRLIEAYLAEHLDYDWSEVHEEADRLEHHISEAFERRVAAALDDPEVDPHGDPIPGADLSPPTTTCWRTCRTPGSPPALAFGSRRSPPSGWSPSSPTTPSPSASRRRSPARSGSAGSKRVPTVSHRSRRPDAFLHSVSPRGRFSASLVRVEMSRHARLMLPGGL